MNNYVKADIPIASSKDVENMPSNQKKDYYSMLQKECLFRKAHKYPNNITKKFLFRIAPLLRNYDLEIYGDENIPLNDSAVFICNHSNSHDFFTIIEAFGKIGRTVTPFGVSDCLNFWTKQLFKLGDVTMIDRNSKASSRNGMLEFSGKILQGKCGIVFGESTWNLHPILPMQPLKIGITNIAKITRKVIIPTIFEYVEVDDVCEKENEIYKKCIVLFGQPVEVLIEDDIFHKTKEIQAIMEDMRRKLWKQLEVKRESLDTINKDIYLNHTFLKKFDALGFVYDSKYEFQFLLNVDKGLISNEYCLDQNGELVPGITNKDGSSWVMIR